MAAGPGKYDKLCTMVREQTGGHGAVIIVVEGNAGHGFSVQLNHDDMLVLPNTLEHIATTMRKDMGIVHINDAIRWQFSMAALNNPGGPEDAMATAVSEELKPKHDIDETRGVEFSIMTAEIIDESIKRLAGVA